MKSVALDIETTGQHDQLVAVGVAVRSKSENGQCLLERSKNLDVLDSLTPTEGDTLEGHISVLCKEIDKCLFTYLFSPKSNTSETLHRARMTLSLMEVWLKYDDLHKFANELAKLKGLRSAMRKRPQEDRSVAQLRRRTVDHALLRLNKLVIRPNTPSSFT